METKELRENHALRLYEEGRITLWKAAEIAGISIWEMLDKIRIEKIPVRYNMEDAKEDIGLVFGD